MKTMIAGLLLLLSAPCHANRTVMEAIAVSNNTVYIDTINARVGISTNSPQVSLDVAGVAQFGRGATKSTFTANGSLNMAAGATISAAAFTSTNLTVNYLQASSATILNGLTVSSLTLTNGNTFSVISAPNATGSGAGACFGCTTPATATGGFNMQLGDASPASTALAGVNVRFASNANVQTDNGTATALMQSINSTARFGARSSSELHIVTNNVPRFSIEPGGAITATANSSFTVQATSFSVGGTNFVVAGTSVTGGSFIGDGSNLTGVVLKTGDTMTGQLTLSGSTLTVTGNGFSVGTSTFVIKSGSVTIGGTAALGVVPVKLDVQAAPIGTDATAQIRGISSSGSNLSYGMVSAANSGAQACVLSVGDQSYAGTSQYVKQSYGRIACANGIPLQLVSANAVGLEMDGSSRVGIGASGIHASDTLAVWGTGWYQGSQAFAATGNGTYSISTSSGISVGAGSVNLGSITQGSALCVNSGGYLSICTSAVGAGGTCTCR